MIAEIERDMVALLATALPDLKVEPFPDKPDAYRLGHQVGAVLVGYRIFLPCRGFFLGHAQSVTSVEAPRWRPQAIRVTPPIANQK